MDGIFVIIQNYDITGKEFQIISNGFRILNPEYIAFRKFLKIFLF